MKARNLVDLLCKEVVELVTEYLSHSMTAEDQVRLEQHLLTCPPCTAYLQQVRATLALTRGLGQKEPVEPAAADTPDVDGDLLSLFRRWNLK
jgi:predicted anti-sigma-YlaC factor YlaD